ncbi:MAG TPA: hypothetical protein VF707_09915 [Ardenticatenaceae bacterium]
MENSLRAATLEEAAERIGRFCGDCGCKRGLTGHVWAASSPRILVQHELAIEDPHHFYLDAIFSDLRLCLSCGDGVPKGSLEIQFSARTFAAVGFGTIGGSGQLSLASRGPHFAEIYYETSRDLFSLVPGRLGMVATGAFEGLVRLEPEAQRELRTMAPVLRDAAERVFRRHSANLIARVPEEPERRDRQLYDVVEARIFVRRSSLFAVFTPHGPVRAVLPDASGRFVLDINSADCATGISFL